MLHQPEIKKKKKKKKNIFTVREIKIICYLQYEYHVEKFEKSKYKSNIGALEDISLFFPPENTFF